MKDFAQNVFKITLEGISDLSVTESIKPMQIQVFKEYDEETNSGTMLLAQSSKLEVQLEAF